MPLRFLHVLRDLRVKQKEEQAKRMSGGTSPSTQNSLNVNNPLAPSNPLIKGFDPSALEEFIDEYT